MILTNLSSSLHTNHNDVFQPVSFSSPRRRRSSHYSKHRTIPLTWAWFTTTFSCFWVFMRLHRACGTSFPKKSFSLDTMEGTTKQIFSGSKYRYKVHDPLVDDIIERGDYSGYEEEDCDNSHANTQSKKILCRSTFTHSPQLTKSLRRLKHHSSKITWTLFLVAFRYPLFSRYWHTHGKTIRQRKSHILSQWTQQPRIRIVALLKLILLFKFRWLVGCLLDSSMLDSLRQWVPSVATVCVLICLCL